MNSPDSVEADAPVQPEPWGFGANATRAQHLAACKYRALLELHAGSPQNAMASMASDLRKHPETERHPGIELGFMQQMAGLLSEPAEVRRWVEGFN